MGLYLYRRHKKACKHHGKPRKAHTRCGCPLWSDGFLRAGKRLNRSLSTPNEAKAHSLVYEWELTGVCPLDIEQPAPGAPSIEGVWDEFLADLPRLSDNRWKLYQRHKGRMLAWAASRGIRTLRRFDKSTAREYASSWIGRYSPRAQRKEIEALKAFFNYALDEEYLDRNPLKRFKTEPVVSEDVKPLSDRELDVAFAQAERAGSRCLAFLLVMLNTGLRKIDVVKLTPDHIHGDQICLRAEKNGAEVLIPAPGLVEMLRELPLLAGGYWFWSGSGDLRLASNKWGDRLRAKVFRPAGLSDVTPHRYRHTFASRLLVERVSTADVARLLGDTEAQVIKTYAQWTRPRQDRLTESFAAALARDPQSVWTTSAACALRGASGNAQTTENKTSKHGGEGGIRTKRSSQLVDVPEDRSQVTEQYKDVRILVGLSCPINSAWYRIEIDTKPTPILAGEP